MVYSYLETFFHLLLLLLLLADNLLINELGVDAPCHWSVSMDKIIYWSSCRFVVRTILCLIVFFIRLICRSFACLSVTSLMHIFAYCPVCSLFLIIFQILELTAPVWWTCLCLFDDCSLAYMSVCFFISSFVCLGVFDRSIICSYSHPTLYFFFILIFFLLSFFVFLSRSLV